MGKKLKASDCTQKLTWKAIICKKRFHYCSAIQVEYTATRNHTEKLLRI